jgi:hypothetical protein
MTRPRINTAALLYLQNLAAVAANYRRAGIRLFVLAYFVRCPGEVQGVREALGLPLRVVRLEVQLPEIERRLAGDVTTGRRDDLREAASSIAAAEGAGVEDVAIDNDRPIGVVAQDVMSFLGWLEAAAGYATQATGGGPTICSIACSTLNGDPDSMKPGTPACRHSRRLGTAKCLAACGRQARQRTGLGYARRH